MKENKINKRSTIETRVWPETKRSFLSKLEEAGISDPGSFTVWLVDEWAKAEFSGIEKVSFNLRILFSLMPMQVTKRGFKFGDAVFIQKYDSSSEKRPEWIRYIDTVAYNSSYQRSTNAIRCLIYATIVSPTKLIADLYNEFVLSKIGRFRFRSNIIAKIPIKEDVYNALKDIYKDCPTTIIRRILDVLLGEEGMIKNEIIKNMNIHPDKYYDGNSKKRIELIIRNDLHRLKVFEFMGEHNIKSRNGLVYSLLDVAMKIPEIISKVRGLHYSNEDSYEQDMYEKMSINYYKYTGL